MDPTKLLAAPAVAGQASFGSSEPVADSFQAVASADVAVVVTDAPPSAPATNYPVGKVDFNKPFEVFNAYDEDQVHTNARVLAVLAGNSYPVVIVSTNTDGEEVVSQFDTDGDQVDGDLRVENIEVVDREMFIVITRENRQLSIVDELFASKADAINDHGNDDSFFAVLPITIPGAKQEIEAADADEDEDEDEGDTDVHTEVSEENLPDGAMLINGMVLQPGDKVRAWRRHRGERTCTVVKFRKNDPGKSALLLPDDGSKRYYAWDNNIRAKIS